MYQRKFDVNNYAERRKVSVLADVSSVSPSSELALPIVRAKVNKDSLSMQLVYFLRCEFSSIFGLWCEVKRIL